MIILELFGSIIYTIVVFVIAKHWIRKTDCSRRSDSKYRNRGRKRNDTRLEKK